MRLDTTQRETAKDAFLYLGESKIINKGLSGRMGKAADFRNLEQKLSNTSSHLKVKVAEN